MINFIDDNVPFYLKKSKLIAIYFVHAVNQSADEIIFEVLLKLKESRLNE
jgi:hypothetical protein